MVPLEGAVLRKHHTNGGAVLRGTRLGGTILRECHTMERAVLSEHYTEG